MSERITIPVDGVEIKFTVTGASVGAALDSYGLKDVTVDPRDIYFFDRFDSGARSPRLFAADVVLRLRGKRGKSGESTLKLRPAEQERLVGDFAAAAGSGPFGKAYKVEIDWSRTRMVAASMDAKVDKAVVTAVLADPHPIAELFGHDQRRLLREAGTPPPDPPDPFEGLDIAGPITSHRWDGFAHGDLAGLRAERWTYRGGRAFLELSLDANDLDDADRLRPLLAQDLADRGLTVDPGATSKTETVLRDLLPRHD